MKIPQWIYIALIVILALLLLTKACESGEVTNTKITTKQVPHTIPEQKGGFEKPTNSSELPPKKPDTVFIGGDPIYVPSPLDPELKAELEKSRNETERYKALAEANREREYSNDFEDEFVSINSKITVYGKLKDNQIKYIMKPRTVMVPETTIEKTVTKNKTVGWLVGAGYKQNIETKLPNYEVNAGIRINKLNILVSGNTRKEVGAGIIVEF